MFKKKNLLRFELNSNNFHIAQPDAYHEFSAWAELQDEQKNEYDAPDEDGVQGTYVSRGDAVLRVLGKCWMECFQEALAGNDELKCIKMKYTGMYSPKEYNYRGDAADFTLEIAKEDFNALACRFLLHRPAFNAWLPAEYRDGPGFWDFMPQDAVEAGMAFLDPIKQWKVLVQIIQYILWPHDEQKDFFAHVFSERVYDQELSADDFEFEPEEKGKTGTVCADCGKTQVVTDGTQRYFCSELFYSIGQKRYVFSVLGKTGEKEGEKLETDVAEEVGMEKIVIDRLYCVGKTLCEGKLQPVFIEVAYNTPRQLNYGQKNELSITGVVGPTKSGNCRRCGQCTDALLELAWFNAAEGWDAASVNLLWEYWTKYHMNAHNAGCAHQDAWDVQRLVGTYEYHRGPAYEKAKKLILAGGCKDLKQYKRLIKNMRMADDVLFTQNYCGGPECMTRAVRALYDAGYLAADAETRTPARWLRFSEHPEGLLGKACSACGYKYGSGWTRRPVPVRVLKWLRDKQDTKRAFNWRRA